ncbi:MAG TPA: hypothetical protein VMV18_06365, partial [bacterium]|nr:hypothetical protein [bacterium]
MRIRASWAFSLLPAVGLGLGLFLHARAPFAATPAAAAAPTPKAGVPAAKTPPAKATAAAGKGKATPAPTPAATPTPEAVKPEKPKEPEKVTVGVYLKQLPDIDVKTNTYTMDFYLWFRWKGDIDPTKSFEFVNGIEPNNTSKVAAYTDDSGNAKPDTLPDGSSYQTYHVQGKFSHPFNLKDYPFDEQDVMIELEDAQHALSDIVYVDDKEQTAIEPHINIPGWTMSAAKTSTSETLYKTTFGDTRITGEDKYSRFSFGVHLRRPIFGYMAKTILPIAIVILI